MAFAKLFLWKQRIFQVQTDLIIFWEKAKIWIINEITTKIAGIVLSSVPTGTVLQGLYTTVPNGFLLCDGQEVAIASFHKLYTEIGSLACCQSSNTGMFKIPDLRGKFLEGANWHLLFYTTAVGKLK